MKFSIRNADKIVGTLVILGLAFLVVVIFLLGTNQRWFKIDYLYKTFFDSASGLSINMPIQFKGFTIGHVKTIELTENGRVEVIFSIFQEHTDRVRAGSLVEVQASPIGLGNTFIFHPGNGNLLRTGEDLNAYRTFRKDKNIIIELFDINSDAGREIIKAGDSSVTESTDNIVAIMSQVRLLLETINIVFTGADGADELPLGKLFGDLEKNLTNLEVVTKSLADHADPIFNDVTTLTGQLTDPTGAIMALLDRKGPIYTALDSISGIADTLNDAVDLLPHQFPELSGLLSNIYVIMYQVNGLLTSLENNPILKKGFPVRTETGPVGASPRSLQF